MGRSREEELTYGREKELARFRIARSTIIRTKQRSAALRDEIGGLVARRRKAIQRGPGNGGNGGDH